MISSVRSYLFTSDSDNVNADESTDDINTDQISYNLNSDDCDFDLNSDDPKSVREDEETEKIFSYSTDQISYDQNSDNCDFGLNSDDPKIVREDEETEKIFSYNEDDSGGLFDVEDGIIKSFNFTLSLHPMTTYSEAEVESFCSWFYLGK